MAFDLMEKLFIKTGIGLLRKYHRAQPVFLSTYVVILIQVSISLPSVSHILFCWFIPLYENPTISLKYNALRMHVWIRPKKLHSMIASGLNGDIWVVSLINLKNVS